MSSNFVCDPQRSPSPPPAAADETPVSHLHLKESSSIPSLLRHRDSFAITRVESSRGLSDRITKVSSVPALLVSVSIKSLALGDYQLWIDDKRVPTPYIPAFRSNVIDFDAHPSCLPGKAFDYVLFHLPRKGLDDIAADLASGGNVQALAGRGRSGPDPTDQKHSSLYRATRLALSADTGPPQSDPRRSCAPKVAGLRNAHGLGRRLGALAETPCDRVAQRESGRANTAL